MLRALAGVWLLAALVAGLCVADEALLRKAWTYRPGSRRELLYATARERFTTLAADWEQDPAVARHPEKDPNAAWLLSHRQATYLVLDEQLAAWPEGAVRGPTLYLVGRLGYGNLSARVAPLLSGTRDDRQRLEVIECLSALQGRASREALADFLALAPKDAGEDVIAAAVRGLGYSRRAEFLPLIRAARKRIKSPAGALEAAKAAYRCGDAGALAGVAALLEQPGVSRELRMEAVSFLCENFSDGALAALAPVASESNDEELALAALWAIINGTGFGRPDPTELPAEEPDPAAVEPPDAQPPDAQPAAESDEGPPPVQGLPGLPPDLGKLSRQERQEVVRMLVNWWNTEGRARAETLAGVPEVS